MANALMHAWNTFTEPVEETRYPSYEQTGYISTTRPDRVRLSTNDRNIVTSVYTRLAIDFAEIDIRHVRVDDKNRYKEDIKSGLNNCLTLAANIDQEARQFKQDIAMRLFDKGTIAIVPVDTDNSPLATNGYDIKTMRVGEIVAWYPRHIRIRLYNDKTGRHEEITLPKETVAIVENPLYAVMNEPNSTLQRLIRKLNLLDYVDEQAGSGKLDLIIQLPYVIKSEARREQAEKRRGDIETQLKGSKYGIAYTDGTEKITQLNRPAENNMLEQIKELTAQLYAQLGLTASVFDGTADEKTMLNYYNRTVKPVVTAVTQAMARTFLSSTAITQGQAIMFFRNMFQMVTVEDLSKFADVFARNEIATSNELRSVLGWSPSTDPKADQLMNSNMPQPTDPAAVTAPPESQGVGSIEYKQIAG